MASYDLLGNIALIKFPRDMKLSAKKTIANKLLKQYKQILTVLEKTNKFSGRLRTQKTKFIAGVKTKESLYKENNCLFRFNIDSCYFSPRLSNERIELAKKTKKGENVLVMFGGVAPFAIVIAKNSMAKRVVSIELSRVCSEYARENVKRNKLNNIEIIQGDVRRKTPREKFARIIMPRPNLRDSFLDIALKRIKPSGFIHYYGFYPEEEKSKLKSLIENEAKKAKKQIKILKIKKAGEIGKRIFRWRVDFKVLG